MDARSARQASKPQPAVQPVSSRPVATVPASRPGRRLPPQQQQQLITQQQHRVATYRQHMQQQQPIAQQQIAQLQQQHRTSQYRFQKQYFERVRQQQLTFQNRRYDYNSDPYFYTAPSYRYFRGGSYYEINRYGVDLLRQAVNNGYEEGYYAGRADRQDHWRSDYEGSYAYQDANYGYSGYYVDSEDYNYYFRQGFQRGYRDGYNSRRQYGRYSNGNYSILGPVLATILVLEALR
jgi:exonuclease VII large subunit